MSDRGNLSLPDMQFNSMHAVHHIKVEGCFPSGRFCLPPACTVRLNVVLMENELYMQLCKEEWNALAASLHLLTLVQSSLEAWPAGLLELSQLHCLKLCYQDCAPVQPLDSTVLSDIPHVALPFRRSAELHYTGGAWKSIFICCACVHFSDVDGFVLGPYRFFLPA